MLGNVGQAVGALLARERLSRIPIEEDLALVGQDAGQGFHDRAFARAVGADQGENFAGRNRKRHIVEQLLLATRDAEDDELREVAS